MTRTNAVAAGAAVVVVAGVWYLFRPDALVIDRTVNESFPMAEAAAMEASLNHGATVAPVDAMASPASAEEPVRMSSGRFHSNAHETTGPATIYRLPDGLRVLRLTEFATSNGPDVRVYLVAADDVRDEDAAKQAGFVDLSALKGNIGDQNYDVPADLDLAAPAPRRGRAARPGATLVLLGAERHVPGFGEGRGVVRLEALATERPVITTALPTGVHEVNVAGTTGLDVPVGDAAELRKAMRRLADDAALRATLGAAGRRRVLEWFTLERMNRRAPGAVRGIGG